MLNHLNKKTKEYEILAMAYCIRVKPNECHKFIEFKILHNFISYEILTLRILYA